MALTRMAAAKVAEGATAAPVIASIFQKESMAKQSSAVFAEAMGVIEKSSGEFPNRNKMITMVEQASVRDAHYFKANLRKIPTLVPESIEFQLSLLREMRKLKADKEFNPELTERIEYNFIRPLLLSERTIRPMPFGVPEMRVQPNTFYELNLSTLRSNLKGLKDKYGKPVVAYLTSMGCFEDQIVAAAKELTKGGCMILSNSLKTLELIHKQVPEAKTMAVRYITTDAEIMVEKAANQVLGIESMLHLNAADAAGRDLKTQVRVQLEVGMERSKGIPMDKVESVVENIKSTHPNLIVEGIYCNPAEIPNVAAETVAAEFERVASNVKRMVGTPDFMIHMAAADLPSLPSNVTHLTAGKRLWGCHGTGGTIPISETGHSVMTIRSRCVPSRKTQTTNKEPLPPGPGLPKIFMGSRDGLQGPKLDKWGIKGRILKNMLVDEFLTEVAVGVDASWVTERKVRPNPMLPVVIHGGNGLSRDQVQLSPIELSNLTYNIPRTVYDPDQWGENALDEFQENLLADRSELVEALLEDLINVESQGLLWVYAEPNWKAVLPYRSYTMAPKADSQPLDRKFSPNEFMLGHKFQYSDSQQELDHNY